MRATLVLVFVAVLAGVEAKTWEEDDMIIVEGRFGYRSFNSCMLEIAHCSACPNCDQALRIGGVIELIVPLLPRVV